MAALQRIQQGVRALFSFTQEVDYALASRYLDEEQLALFRQLARSEQLHSLNVLRAVLGQAPETPHDLAVAALLHDIGKTRYRMALWERTAVVLLRKLAPALYESWSAPGTLDDWRAPFGVYRYHPQWGAELLQATTISPRALWLVQHHQEDAAQWRAHPHHTLLLRLQKADDAN